MSSYLEGEKFSRHLLGTYNVPRTMLPIFPLHFPSEKEDEVKRGKNWRKSQEVLQSDAAAPRKTA